MYEPGRGFGGLVEEWWLDGERHRAGGPAIVYEPGRGCHGKVEEWWRKGELVRIITIEQAAIRLAIAMWGDAREKTREDPPAVRPGNVKKRVVVNRRFSDRRSPNAETCPGGGAVCPERGDVVVFLQSQSGIGFCGWVNSASKNEEQKGIKPKKNKPTRRNCYG